MNQVYEATAKTPFMIGDCKFFIRHVQTMADGRISESADPTSDNLRGGIGAATILETKAEAFEAARLICADKVESVMLTGGS